EQPAPKLTRLDVHGFKSFATRTAFRFEPGITAIVGPNGSGKSNISDAVRWVLGETSYSALRSKKTEDVIFAGGKGRSPSGMAEVTVTFNNEDRWLPSDFIEVTVTRRAYRSGENQYLINGRKVRLRDIAVLTASLGQSYTVVGQGLVDQALSQRAEDRRGMFEHAADLAGLRIKVAESERNLNETNGNVNRLTDLLTELEPRLRRLERQAKQAQAWQELNIELRDLQRRHYRRVLRIARDQLAAAERHLAVDEATLESTRAEVKRLGADRTTQQRQLAGVREALDEHGNRARADEERLRQARHQHDLVRERIAALDRRRADMVDTHHGLDDQRDAVERERQMVADALATLTGDLDTARQAFMAQQAASRLAREREQGFEREIGDLASSITAAEQQLREIEQQHALLRQRLETGDDARERGEHDDKDRARRIDELQRELEAFNAEDDRIGDQLLRLEEQINELSGQYDAARAQADEHTSSITSLDSRIGRAENRLEVLQRVHESGTGLYAGVRQVTQWHRDGTLTGVRGTVAELVSVDAEYDTAIEVALGGHVQDVVVDAWRDAERAIDMLKQARAGRVTFQPIETVARRADNRPPPDAANANGAHGVASELVDAADDVRPVVVSLLGRIVVVDDLSTARRVLPELPRGFSAVTLSGEIARSGGSVTGGSAVRESGVLGRERELRELPDEIRRLTAERDELEQQRQDALASLASYDAQRNVLMTERTETQAMRRERSGQRARLEGWQRDLQREQEGATSQREASRQDRTSQEAEIDQLASRRATVQAEIDSARARHQERIAAFAAWRDEHDHDASALGDARQAVATLEERARSEQRRLDALGRQRQGIDDELALREQRLREVDAEQQGLTEQAESVSTRIGEMDAAVATIRAEREPLEESRAKLEASLTGCEAALDAGRNRLLEQERGLGQRGLVAERARADLGSIRQRITDDLELDDPDSLLREAGTPTDDDDHEEVERRISRLRERLRRMGYVGEDVVEEFERESAHYTFVRTQLDDVEDAAASLRRMLDDLKTTMEQRFEETFARVAEAFSESFTALFGGGSAKLVLTTDHEGETGGIDIVAQPPGKRLQGLGLLSGGERSLTGVALLFAILRVNPTPFVLLDEVDAALDEANVVRFRNELRKLARETEAIVITHNRGTVEIADTLYGVTMGGDGVSQVLSLRLTDLPLDEDIDIRDLPAVTAGVPVR
ncbi:MAG: chromosome segregation protein SMC, partial [Chloroflexia bacterium]|nr:chromosome segregation protein SMC [Chloroflexia bacterium]